MKLVSVVMPTYNNEIYLREAIDSILNQTYRNFELIIVDDASTDNTPDILKSFKDKRIKNIRHDRNFGVSVSRNDGMDSARGDYIAVMDGDDISYPDRLERQVEYLDTNPDYSVVGCAIIDNIDSDGVLLFRTNLVKENDEIQRTLKKKWCFQHSSVMFRKDLLAKIGAYRKEFIVAEDHDFLLRAIEHCKAHNINENLIAYRINTTSLTVLHHDRLSVYENLAFDLARARRCEEKEELKEKLDRITNVRDGVVIKSFISRVKNTWNKHFYVSAKYYGFGCKNFYFGNIELARLCFKRSLKYNILYYRSWLCLFISLMPDLLRKKIRWIFSTTKQYYNDIGEGK